MNSSVGANHQNPIQVLVTMSVRRHFRSGSPSTAELPTSTITLHFRLEKLLAKISVKGI
jgi:hypothetical protein